MQLPPPWTPGSAVGLSFFLEPGGLVEHTGSQAGFRSLLTVNPRTSEAVIFAFNTTNEASEEKSDDRLRLLMHEARALIER